MVTPIGAILAAATGVTMRSRGHQGFSSVVTRSRRFSGKVKTVTERARIRLGTYQSNMQGDEFEYGRTTLHCSHGVTNDFVVKSRGHG